MVEQMSGFFPEIKKRQERVQSIIEDERVVIFEDIETRKEEI